MNIDPKCFFVNLLCTAVFPVLYTIFFQPKTSDFNLPILTWLDNISMLYFP